MTSPFVRNEPKLWKIIPVVLLAAVLPVVNSTQGASTFVRFSVDLSNQVANATFNPVIDTVVVNGTFNGFGLSGAPLTLSRVGSSTVYTNTLHDTTDTNDGKIEYKFGINFLPTGYENTATGQNRASRLPAISGDNLVLPTPYFSDAGPVETNLVTFRVDMDQQIRLGGFDPASHTVSVRGNFNGWGTTALAHAPSILYTNQSGAVSSNVYVGTIPIKGSHAAASAYKFYYHNGADQWELPNSVNTESGGNRYFANVPQTLPIFQFSDGDYVPTTALSVSVVGPAVQTIPTVPVLFTNTATNLSNQVRYVIGDIPQLGAWDPTKAVRMVSTGCAGGPCDWSVTVGIPEGTAYQYKFMWRDECPATPECYGNPANGVIESGPIRVGATPPGPPAPYAGKTVFFYSTWTNVSILYSNHTSGWTTQAMARVEGGRVPGETLWRASGLNNAGDPSLFFVFTDNAGRYDNADGIPSRNYETPLDAVVVQGGQLFNYWPPQTVSNSRVTNYFLNSTNLQGRMVRIYLPRGYNENTTKRYPVLYMHDGQNLFLGMGIYGSWNSDKNADKLIRSGKMREMIIVGLDNTTDRTTDYLPDYCGGNGHKYASLILNEVKPVIDSTYRTLSDRDNTATMGSSMGGLISFYLGWEYNAYFGRIAPMSTFFPACLQEKLRLGPPFPSKSLRIYTDSGTTDPGVPNDDVGDNIEARDNLVKNGFVINKDLLHVIGYGQTHNERWWDYRTPYAWTFLFPATEEPNTVLDRAHPPRITNFQLGSGSNVVTWTSYRARTYTLEGATNVSVSSVMNWSNVFTTPSLEPRPWNYPSAAAPEVYHFFRVKEHAVPSWPY